MPRPPSQTREALRKDIERLDLIIERARRSEREPKLNQELIAKLTWARMKLTEEALVRQQAAMAE